MGNVPGRPPVPRHRFEQMGDSPRSCVICGRVEDDVLHDTTGNTDTHAVDVHVGFDALFTKGGRTDIAGSIDTRAAAVMERMKQYQTPDVIAHNDAVREMRLRTLAHKKPPVPSPEEVVAKVEAIEALEGPVDQIGEPFYADDELLYTDKFLEEMASMPPVGYGRVNTPETEALEPSGDLCTDCGGSMIRTGACHTCPDCGSTSGCG